MKSFKARIYYNGYYDMNIDAPTEAHARDIIEDIALDYSEDVKLSYDFADIDEIEVYKHA